MKTRIISLVAFAAILATLITSGAQTSSAAQATATVAATMAATAVANTTCAPDNTARVASDASYQPFESVNTTTNKIEGFDVDLLNAISKSQGFQVAYTNENFDTIFEKLAAADYDLVISAVTITADRQKTVDFSNPYFLSGQAMIVRKADTGKYKTVADLAGLKIGVQKGTTGADFASDPANIKNAAVTSYVLAPEAFTALANKDVEAIIIDTPVALNIIGDQPTLNLVVVLGNLTDEKYGIAVRKECGDLLNKVNAGLRAVTADGTYNKIYRQYFGEDAPAAFLAGASAASTMSATMSATMASTSASMMSATMAATAAK